MVQFLKLTKGNTSTFLALLFLMLIFEMLLFNASIVQSLKLTNISTAGATMLFCGTYIADKKKAIITGLLFVLIAQLVIALRAGTINIVENIFVILALLLVAGLGFFVQRNIQRQTIMVASLVGSMLIYLFKYTGRYVGNISSEQLLDTLVLNLQHFRGIVMGDLLFNLILFGSFSLISWISKQNTSSN